MDLLSAEKEKTVAEQVLQEVGMELKLGHVEAERSAGISADMSRWQSGVPERWPEIEILQSSAFTCYLKL